MVIGERTATKWFYSTDVAVHCRVLSSSPISVLLLARSFRVLSSSLISLLLLARSFRVLSSSLISLLLLARSFRVFSSSLIALLLLARSFRVLSSSPTSLLWLWHLFQVISAMLSNWNTPRRHRVNMPIHATSIRRQYSSATGNDIVVTQHLTWSCVQDPAVDDFARASNRISALVSSISNASHVKAHQLG